MVVVISNELPPAVRGRLKLWFIEPKPNVFISGIKDSIAKEVIEYLLESCTEESGLIVFQKINKAPGYKIWWGGQPKRKSIIINGLQLILEKEQ